MRRLGFTLVEVLLAMVVAVMVLVVVAQGVASGARATSAAERRSTAAMLAEQKMSELESGETTLVRGLPGDFAPDHAEYRFDVVSNLKTSPDLYEVTVRVSWEDHGTQTFELVRLLRQKTS